jgi:hypothetical protein
MLLFFLEFKQQEVEKFIARDKANAKTGNYSVGKQIKQDLVCPLF